MLDTPPTLALKGHPSTPRGRSLTATQPFAPGQSIALFSTPSVAIPDSPHIAQVCNHCLSPLASPRACTGCRTAAYCSPRCQKADWGLVHARECKVLQKVRAMGHEALPTPVRALVQTMLRPEKLAAASALEGHVEAFRGKGEVWRDMELQAMAALHYTGRQATTRNIGEAVEILCKLQVNSFNRLDADVGQAGLFLSPELAMVNHSCMPNAFVQFFGRKAVLKAYQGIKQDEEIEISYIDCTLHRSHRQQALKERYHFECLCRRCKNDLDVYQVCQAYPHLDLNKFSLAPNLECLRSPPIKEPYHLNKSLQRSVEEIYPSCSATLIRPGSADDPIKVLRYRWQQCETLRKAGLFAIEPLPQVLVEASIYFGECGNFSYSLAISCFLALNSDPFKTPIPFSAQRVKGLLMIAKLLSNADPAISTRPSNDGSVRTRLAQALAGMDHATIAQAVLAMAVCYGPLAHSEEWQVCQEARELLHDITNLPGREKENALINAWAGTQSDLEGSIFFEHAVLRPVHELSEFALDIMDIEFKEQSLVHRR